MSGPSIKPGYAEHVADSPEDVSERRAPDDSAVWPVASNPSHVTLARAVDGAQDLLSSLAVNVEWLRSVCERELNRPDVREALSDVQICSRRLGRILEMAVLAVRGDTVLTRPCAVNIGDLVNAAVLDADPRGRARGIRVESVANVGVVAVVDGVLVGRAIESILDHAIVCSDDGGSVSVSFAPADNRLKLEVSYGRSHYPASDPAEVGYADPLVAHSEAQLGIGLAFCRSVARAHGGDVRGCDHEGGGSVITLCIPWSMPDANRVDK